MIELALAPDVESVEISVDCTPEVLAQCIAVVPEVHRSWNRDARRRGVRYAGLALGSLVLVVIACVPIIGGAFGAWQLACIAIGILGHAIGAALLTSVISAARAVNIVVPEILRRQEQLQYMANLHLVTNGIMQDDATRDLPQA